MRERYALLSDQTVAPSVREQMGRVHAGGDSHVSTERELTCVRSLRQLQMRERQ